MDRKNGNATSLKHISFLQSTRSVKCLKYKETFHKSFCFPYDEQCNVEFWAPKVRLCRPKCHHAAACSGIVVIWRTETMAYNSQLYPQNSTIIYYDPIKSAQHLLRRGPWPWPTNNALQCWINSAILSRRIDLRHTTSHVHQKAVARHMSLLHHAFRFFAFDLPSAILRFIHSQGTRKWHTYLSCIVSYEDHCLVLPKLYPLIE